MMLWIEYESTPSGFEEDNNSDIQIIPDGYETFDRADSLLFNFIKSVSEAEKLAVKQAGIELVTFLIEHESDSNLIPVANLARLYMQQLFFEKPQSNTANKNDSFFNLMGTLVRARVNAHPNDSVMREDLVRFICEAWKNSEEGSEDILKFVNMGNLRDFMLSNPDDPIVRHLFSNVLMTGADDTDRRLKLLQELRDLYSANPDDSAVRLSLAKKLFAMGSWYRICGSPEDEDSFLDELFALVGC